MKCQPCNDHHCQALDGTGRLGVRLLNLCTDLAVRALQMARSSGGAVTAHAAVTAAVPVPVAVTMAVAGVAVTTASAASSSAPIIGSSTNSTSDADSDSSAGRGTTAAGAGACPWSWPLSLAWAGPPRVSVTACASASARPEWSTLEEASMATRKNPTEERAEWIGSADIMRTDTQDG